MLHDVGKAIRARSSVTTAVRVLVRASSVVVSSTCAAVTRRNLLSSEHVRAPSDRIPPHNDLLSMRSSRLNAWSDSITLCMCSGKCHANLMAGVELADEIGHMSLIRECTLACHNVTCSRQWITLAFLEPVPLIRVFLADSSRINVSLAE